MGKMISIWAKISLHCSGRTLLYPVSSLLSGCWGRSSQKCQWQKSSCWAINYCSGIIRENSPSRKWSSCISPRQPCHRGRSLDQVCKCSPPSCNWKSLVQTTVNQDFSGIHSKQSYKTSNSRQKSWKNSIQNSPSYLKFNIHTTWFQLLVACPKYSNKYHWTKDRWQFEHMYSAITTFLGLRGRRPLDLGVEFVLQTLFWRAFRYSGPEIMMYENFT